MENLNVYTIKVTGWKDDIQCIKIEDGIGWILYKRVYDYTVDGILLINKRFIKSCIRTEKEIFTEDVLRANNKLILESVEIPLDTFSLFNNLYLQNKVFQVTLKDDSYVYIGKIEKIIKKSFYFRKINAKGRWVESIFLRMDFIRAIEFDSEYIISLLVYSDSVDDNLIVK